jgi:hypothetical protein
MNKSNYCHSREGLSVRNSDGGGVERSVTTPNPGLSRVKRSSRDEPARASNPLLSLSILILLALSPSPSHAGLRESLTSALQTYCIPKDVKGCGIMMPRYQDSSCYCGNSIYMYYDSVDRTCRVRCPAGQIARAASVCPTAGYGGKLVKDF